MDLVKKGGRIKYYRELLGITQKELAMGRLSPELIYLLENNRRKLTTITASILVSNFHDIAKEKGISMEFELRDLLMSDKEYADILCSKWVEELKADTYDESKCQKIIALGEKYHLYQTLSTAYEKIFSFNFNKRNYLKALGILKQLISVYSLAGNKSQEISTQNRIGTCYHMLQDYDNAYFYYKSAYERFHEYGLEDTILEDKLLYNLALTTSKQQKYEEALSYIDRLDLVFINDEPHKHVNLILKAGVLLNTGETEEALNIYKYLVNMDLKYLYVVQNNMALAFMKLGRISESIEFFTKSINNQLNSISPSTTISLVKLAEVYFNEKRYEEALIFYGYGIENGKKFNQTDKILNCYENIYNACTEMHQLTKFEYYYKSLGDLYDNFEFDKEQLERLQELEQNYISNVKS